MVDVIFKLPRIGGYVIIKLRTLQDIAPSLYHMPIPSLFGLDKLHSAIIKYHSFTISYHIKGGQSEYFYGI